LLRGRKEEIATSGTIKKNSHAILIIFWKKNNLKIILIIR
jgi:hypothetical protein